MPAGHAIRLGCRLFLHIRGIDVLPPFLNKGRRETYRDRGADADFTLQIETASVRFDQGLGQWQAKARPLVLAAEIAVDLAELRQRLWNVFRRNANSCVHDLEYEATVGAAPAVT